MLAADIWHSRGEVLFRAFSIGAFEVGRWRSAREGAPYGYSIVAVLVKDVGRRWNFGWM